MTVHAGNTYTNEDVSIGPPDLNLWPALPKAPDVGVPVSFWLSHALEKEDVYYFGIFWRQLPVGQILLHDINYKTLESLVAYHLFEPKYRRQGIGTKALGLLQQFVVEETELQRLIIITSNDNIGSQTIARRCGFTYAGPSREEPDTGVVFMWNK